MDLRKGFSRTKPGQRPLLVLRPAIGKIAYIKGKKRCWVTNVKAPWWAPYSELTSAALGATAEGLANAAFGEGKLSPKKSVKEPALKLGFFGRELERLRHNERVLGQCCTLQAQPA